MKNRIRAFALGLAALLATSTASAQTPPSDTPAASDDQGFVAKAEQWVKDSKIVERLQGDVDGWYPRLGGMVRGSGFSLGPGYRRHVFDDKVLVDLSTGVSIRWYKVAEARVRWLQAFDDRAEVWTEYRYEDDPQEDFWGMGPETRQTTRTSYTYRASDFKVRGEVKPTRWLHAGATLGYLYPDIASGHDSLFPSTEALFTDQTAPGLAQQPHFLHTQLFAHVDYRDVPGNPRRGGFYQVAYSTWNDRTLDQYDFRRLNVDLMQHVPLRANQRHVLSGRFSVDLVNNAGGERVPFYFLPYVGGVDTIRSFREYRFKDENAFSMSAEYRYIVGKWWSAAVFGDAGKVTHRWDQMDLANLRGAYGVGLLVHSEKQTFAGFYVGAGGGEGVRTYLRIGLGL